MNRRWWAVLGVAVAAIVTVVVVVMVGRDDGSAPVAPVVPVAQNLQAQVVGPARVQVGRPFQVTGFASGSAAQPSTVRFCFGDGTCTAPRPSCTPQAPGSPKPAGLEDKRTHTFMRAGTFTVRFEVDGGCSGYSGSASAILKITAVPRL